MNKTLDQFSTWPKKKDRREEIKTKEARPFWFENWSVLFFIQVLAGRRIQIQQPALLVTISLISFVIKQWKKNAPDQIEPIFELALTLGLFG